MNIKKKKRNFPEDTKDPAQATAVSILTGPDIEQRDNDLSEPLRSTFSMSQKGGKFHREAGLPA